GEVLTQSRILLQRLTQLLCGVPELGTVSDSRTAQGLRQSRIEGRIKNWEASLVKWHAASWMVLACQMLVTDGSVKGSRRVCGRLFPRNTPVLLLPRLVLVVRAIRRTE